MLEQHLKPINYLGLVFEGCYGKGEVETTVLQDQEEILHFE